MFLSTEKTSQLEKVLFYWLPKTEYSFISEFGNWENYSKLKHDSDWVFLTSSVPSDIWEWTSINSLYTVNDLERILMSLKEKNALRLINFSLSYWRDIGLNLVSCQKEEATVVVLESDERIVFEEGETLEENIADLILSLIK